MAYPKRDFKISNFFLIYGRSIKANVFSSQYKSYPIPSGGLEMLLVFKILIFKEKSAILKHLQNLIDLNYEELASMDTP